MTGLVERLLADGLALAAGAGLAWGVLAEGLRREAETRARLAEGLLERAARRRSEAVASGNRTRASKRRAQTRAMTAQLREDIQARLAREFEEARGEDDEQAPLDLGGQSHG